MIDDKEAVLGAFWKAEFALGYDSFVGWTKTVTEELDRLAVEASSTSVKKWNIVTHICTRWPGNLLHSGKHPEEWQLTFPRVFRSGKVGNRNNSEDGIIAEIQEDLSGEQIRALAVAPQRVSVAILARAISCTNTL